MKIFDIFISYVSWNNGGKIRPVLILERQASVVFVFNITTQYSNKSESIRSKYFKINDWQQAGLEKQSYIDTNNVRDLPPSALNSKLKIGNLTDSDKKRLIEFLSN